MRLVWFLFLIVPFAAGIAKAAPHYSKPEVRREITAVVEAQLAAFRADNLAGAYGFAATPLRARLTLEQFAVMMARGYPLILHHARAELGLPVDDGGWATIVVRVSIADGTSAAYRYHLLKEAAGWRIAGVDLEQTHEADA